MKTKYITPYADEWFSGPPPSVGWWPASWDCRPEVLRYWNGKYFSVCATDNWTAEEVAVVGTISGRYQDQIKWAKRWWEKAE